MTAPLPLWAFFAVVAAMASLAGAVILWLTRGDRADEARADDLLPTDGEPVRSEPCTCPSCRFAMSEARQRLMRRLNDAALERGWTDRDDAEFHQLADGAS